MHSVLTSRVRYDSTVCCLFMMYLPFCHCGNPLSYKRRARATDTRVQTHSNPTHYQRSGNKGTQTCLPAAHVMGPSAAWYGPASAPTRQDPHEGPSLVRQTTPRPPEGAATLGMLLRSGVSYAGAQPHEVEVTQAMTTKARRAPAGIEEQVSSWVLRRQAQVRGPEESAKGFHSCATRPRPPGQQDGCHHRAHRSVMSRSFASEDHLSSG
jgi:hypothetical protein